MKRYILGVNKGFELKKLLPFETGWKSELLDDQRFYCNNFVGLSYFSGSKSN